MKKIVNIFFIILMMILGGCDNDFAISAPTKGELCLICYPGTRDTTVIQLYKTVPVGESYKGSSFLKSAAIVYNVDGVGQKVEYASDWTGSVPKGCWYVPGRLEGGSEVEISAAVESEINVMASTRIPAMPPAFDFSLEFGAWTELNISFDDDPATDDYYGVAVVCEWPINNRLSIRNLCPLAEGSGTDVVAVLRDYYDVGFSGLTLLPHQTDIYGVRVWSDAKFNGKRASLTARFDPASVDSPRYKILLYSFTEEFYRYMAALDYQDGNAYAMYGIIPMKLSFTNVSGGCGILAGWSMRESDWFEMDFFKVF